MSCSGGAEEVKVDVVARLEVVARPRLTRVISEGEWQAPKGPLAHARVHTLQTYGSWLTFLASEFRVTLGKRVQSYAARAIGGVRARV